MVILVMPLTFSVGKLTDIFISCYTNCKYVLVYFILILFWIMIVIKPANNLFNILSRCICLTILFFSCSVVSYSLRPHGLQHTSVPCYSLFPEVWSNFCLLNQWCHPTISSSVVPLSPSAFSLSQHQDLYQWISSLHSGQSTGASALASVFPMNIQDWFPLGLILGFLDGLEDKESSCNAGDLGSIPRLGRSPGAGNGNLLQYCCLENPYGQRHLVGDSPWGHKKLDMTVTKHSTA